MAQVPYVMGIDFGTESARVGIFDLTGRPVIFAFDPYPLYHPHAAPPEPLYSGSNDGA